MTDRRVDSAAAGSNDGTSWANAYTTIGGAAGADAAGDRIFIDDGHSETGAIGTLAWAGTVDNMVQIISVDKATGETPTGPSAGATITCNSGGMVMSGSIYMRGVTLDQSANTAMQLGSTTGHHQIYEGCTIKNSSSNNGNIGVRAGPLTSLTNSSLVEFLECTLGFSALAHSLSVSGKVRLVGGALVDLGTDPDQLLKFTETSGEHATAEVLGFDISAGKAAINIANQANTAPVSLIAAHCKLPTSWSGDVFSAIPTLPGIDGQMIACSDADGTFRCRKMNSSGFLREETTNVRSGGWAPVDGNGDSTPCSWKIDASTGDAAWPGAPFRSLTMPIYITSAMVGSALTVTVPILYDDASERQDDDIELVVGHMATNGSVLYTFASSAPEVLESATDLNTLFGTSSGWDTTGMSNAKQRNLQVTFTPQEIGIALAWVNVYQRAVFYVDPLPVLS